MAPKHQLVSKLVLASVVLVSGLLWLQGSDWGQPYDFHSDESRYLTGIVDDPAVPFWTIYGRWPIFILKAVAWVTGQPALNVMLARRVSTLVVLAGLVAAALSTQRLADWTGAVITVALLAGAPVVVQSSHFFITDVFLFTGVAAAVFFGMRVAQSERRRDALGLGLAWGLAMGSKPSGLFLLPAVGLAYFLSPPTLRWQRLVLSLSVAAGLALVGQPTLLVHGLDEFLNEGAFLHHLGVAAGTYLPSYALQFENTPAWTYYITHLLSWGAGLVLLALGCVGGILAVVRLVGGRRRWRSDAHLGQLAIALVVFLAFYLMSASQRDKFTRYVLPLLPSLAILAGWSLTDLTQRVNASLRRWIIAVTVIGALIPGLFYTRIYRRPDTRLQAAAWVAQNVPAESVICHEPDLGFAVPPIGLGGPAYGDTLSQDYRGTLLNWGLLYAASDYLRENQSAPVIETPEMQSVRTQVQQQLRIQSWLATCDWLVLSDRFADQYLPLPDDFAAISTFYMDLLSGRHRDFQKVAEFKSQPGMFNISVNDRSSELTFRSFDHPTIWIFRRG